MFAIGFTLFWLLLAISGLDHYKALSKAHPIVRPIMGWLVIVSICLMLASFFTLAWRIMP